jgi:hypothetical protein
MIRSDAISTSFVDAAKVVIPIATAAARIKSIKRDGKREEELASRSEPVSSDYKEQLLLIIYTWKGFKLLLSTRILF